MKKNTFKTLTFVLILFSVHSSLWAQDRYITAAQLHVSITLPLVFNAYINGDQLVNSQDHLNDAVMDVTHDFTKPERCTLSRENSLEISVDQVFDKSHKTNSMMGLAYVLKLTFSDNAVMYISSDDGQTHQYRHEGFEPNGWLNYGFDDHSWGQADVYQPTYMGVTLINPQTQTTAKYFKTFDDGGDNHMEQTSGNRVFFRRDFDLAVEQAPECSQQAPVATNPLPAAIVPILTATRTFTRTPPPPPPPTSTPRPIPPTSTFTPPPPLATATPIPPPPTWTPRPQPTATTYVPRAVPTIPPVAVYTTRPVWAAPSQPAVAAVQPRSYAPAQSAPAIVAVQPRTYAPAQSVPAVASSSLPYLPPSSAPIYSANVMTAPRPAANTMALPPLPGQTLSNSTWAGQPTQVAAPITYGNYWAYQATRGYYGPKPTPTLAPQFTRNNEYAYQSQVQPQPQAQAQMGWLTTSDLAVPTAVPPPSRPILTWPTVWVRQTETAAAARRYIPPTSTSTQYVWPTETFTPVPVRKKRVVVKRVRQWIPTPTVAPAPPPAGAGGAILAFSSLPININASFADGPGLYQCEIVDKNGNHVSIVYRKQVAFEKDDWISWDATNDKGQRMPRGYYYAVFTKDGGLIRKMLLSWAGQ